VICCCATQGTKANTATVACVFDNQLANVNEALAKTPIHPITKLKKHTSLLIVIVPFRSDLDTKYKRNHID
jgi:hypothetical protein